MKTIYFVLLILVLLSGCGDADSIGCLDGCSNRPKDGKDGAVGKQGPKGDQGPAGIPGTSCIAVPISGGANLVCGSNPPVFIANGLQGVPGLPGANCSVTTLLPSNHNPTGGATITCGSSSVVVINGSTSGSASAYNVVGTIDPCGSSGSSNHDEIFLRMASGQLVSLFVENGSALTARLSYVLDGTGYQTTDSQHCNFSITTNSSGIRTLTTTSPISSSISWQTY